MNNINQYITDKDPYLIDILSSKMTGLQKDIWLRTEQTDPNHVVIEIDNELYLLDQLVKSNIQFFIDNYEVIKDYWMGKLWSEDLYETLKCYDSFRNKKH